GHVPRCAVPLQHHVAPGVPHADVHARHGDVDCGGVEPEAGSQDAVPADHRETPHLPTVPPRAVRSPPMLWRRPDGDLVRGLSPTKGIMPYIMRGGNESAVYFEQQVGMRGADRFVREFNERHPDTPINIQHLVMWAIVHVLTEFPTMNRFVTGGRLYQRRGI